MRFANLFTVILLLVAAGLAVLAGLPVLRRWQRKRDGGWGEGAVRAGEAPAGYGADVAMEERGRLTQPDQLRLVDNDPLDDQDEQMRNRPADEQHHRHSQLGGSERLHQAEEPDPRRAPAVPVNGRYGGFGDVNGDPHAYDVNGGYEHEGANGGYEPVGEPDEAGRAAHFDWKVAAQYERARAARNASMSSFDPPPLPNDGPGTFTEEIPAIHAADGQRRHPAVHPDPEAPGRAPLMRRHAPAEPPAQSPYGDPWDSDGAEHAPPAFEFDEQQGYEPYDERERPGYDREPSPYEGFPQPADAEELAPPPHMRWRPDPEPDPAELEEPAAYGGHAGPPGPRQAFSATTFRVQPAAEEPVAVHVAEPGVPAGPHGAYAGADPAAATEAHYAAEPVAPPGGYAAHGVLPDEQPVDGWVGEDTAVYSEPEPAHGFAGGYAPPAAPAGYDPGRYDPPARQPVFEEPAEPPAADGAPFGRFTPAADPQPPPRPPLPDLSPLFAEDEVTELLQRWNQIKGTFPDDPVTSVKEASKLVGECTKLFERRLGVDPDGAEVSTEELRLALQRYLAFFERLLSS